MYNKKCFTQIMYSYQYSSINDFPTISLTIFSNKAIKCPSSCLGCYLKNGTMKCSSVKEGFRLEGESTLSLVPCKNNCGSCSSNGSNCLACIQGFAMQNNSCFKCSDKLDNCLSCQSTPTFNCTQCVPMYFLESNLCKKCRQNCLICYNSTSCSQCQSGYMLYINPNSSLDQCIPCIQGCESCKFDNRMMICLSCYPGYLISGFSINYFPFCAPCPENCRSCTDIFGKILCMVCFSGFKNINFACQPSVSNCFAYDYEKSCISCYLGYELVNGSCLLESFNTLYDSKALACSQKQYLQNFTCFAINVNSIVQNCIEYNAVSCISCKEGYYIGYDLGDKVKCLPCPTGCKQCQTLYRCLVPQEGYYLKSEYFQMILPKKCSPNCRTCIDVADMCSSCEDGEMLTSSRKCVGKTRFNMKIQLDISYENIPSVLYLIDINIQTNWPSVPSKLQLVNLQAASSTATNLTYSIYGAKAQISNQHRIFSEYFYSDTQKSVSFIMQNISVISVEISNLTQCPDRYMLDSTTQTCVKIEILHCHLYENFYDNAVTCKSCENGFILSQDHLHCSLNCTAIGLTDCIICYNETICQQCRQGYILSVTNICTNGNIPNCIKFQKTPQGTHKCIQCKTYPEKNQTVYRIINNACLYRQPQQYWYGLPGIMIYYGSSLFRNLYQIIQCIYGCKICSSLYSCEICMDGYKMIVEPVTGYQICVICTGQFMTCQDENASCYPGFVLNYLTNTCQKCDTENCFSCSQTDFSLCIECLEGFYLSSNHQCNSCSTQCKKCKSSTMCLECQAGYFLLQNSSLSTCLPCPLGCASCNQDECLMCYPGFYTLINNSTQIIRQCAEQIQNCWSVISYGNGAYCQQYVLSNIKYGAQATKCSVLIDHCQSCNSTNKYRTCSLCYYGYELNQNGTCQVKNSQKPGEEIFPCDKGPFLETGPSCTSCVLNDTNCLKCYWSICLQCKNRYYIESYNLTSSPSTFCKPCTIEGCLNCKSNKICLTCSEGYFMKNTTNLSTGVCEKCDTNCLTCYERSNFCTSCRSLYQLTSSRSCVGSYSSNFTLKLNIQKDAFFLQLNQFLLTLGGMVNDNTTLTPQQKSKSIQILSIKKGSTIIEGVFTSSSAESLTTTVSNYQKQIQTGGIMGIPLVGVGVTITLPAEVITQSNTTYIIISASITGFIVILLVLGICFILRQKKQLKEIMEKNVEHEIKRRENHIHGRNRNSLQLNSQGWTGSQSNIIGKKDGLNWEFY